MTDYRVAIIGTGRPHRSEGSTGYGMAHSHIEGYRASPGCMVVACADIVPENAQAFAERYDIPRTYTDYREMLAKDRPDIVSICTWPQLHAEMVINAAKAGTKAIHCEKPMAPTFGEARRMKETCEKAGVQLTFNHQRRFEKRFILARQLVKDGVIGDLRRMEGHWGNMLDVGTHWLDLFNFYNDDAPAQWVIGQIDRAGDPASFGVPVESQALVHIRYRNGVYGFLAMGQDHTIWAEHRLLGSEGIIEVDWPVVRVRGKGDREWRILDGEAADGSIRMGVQDLVDALRTGREPVLGARKAFAATEVIFATYESCRRRARIDLPLTIDDNPLHALIAAGEIGPKPVPTKPVGPSRAGRRRLGRSRKS